MESGRWAGHADEFETSIALAAFPERIRYRGIDLTHFDRAAYDDRKNFEQSKLATAEKGEIIITHAATWLAEKLKGMMG